MNEINTNAPLNVKSNVPTHAGHGKKLTPEDTSSTTPSNTDEISLSDEAKSFLENIPGKSVAHQARAALAEDGFEALAGLPFGKIVSTLARGEDLSSLLPKPEVEEASEEPVDATADEVLIIPTEEEPTETILGDADIALSLLTPLDEEAA